MDRFKPIAELTERNGWLLHEHFAALADWPSSFPLPSPHFVLFLALDARTLGADTIGALAELLLDKGLAYLVAWGPDCERVHDIFDGHIVDREVVRHIAPVGCVMTTWHTDDSLAEAFEFFALLAAPVEPQWQCESWLAVTIGEPAWEDEVRRLIPQFGQSA